MMTLFGIPQCDTVAGVPEDLLDRWLAEFGWETVINRRGTSWRRLPQVERDAMTTALARAAALKYPSLIKRPILVLDQFTLIGFDPEQWQHALTQEAINQESINKVPS
ncbi:MAG: arsenate reductase [Halothiobacillus sp.]|nr:arsenate reductase [Halothiobacillus sp.]